MSIKTDPSFYKSEFLRNEGDRYWTEQPAAAAIARRIPEGIKTVWEPAGGRGDLARVIKDYGFDVLASDINPSEFDTDVCVCEEASFIDVYAEDPNNKKKKVKVRDAELPSFFIEEPIDAIISNSPFGDEAEAFVRKALSFENVRYVAFLLRSEWKHSKGRLDLFTEPRHHYCKEVVLTWRPRWDWWFRDKPEASPRHNYSWFVWDREHVGPAIQEFATRIK